MTSSTERDIATKFWSLVTKTDDCWLWTGRSLNHGYGQLWVNGKRWIASRLAWTLTHGEITDRRQMVCHRCDNPQCVRPNHLFLASQDQNLADMRAKGRARNGLRPRGCFNTKAVFTENQVRQIRQRYANGDSLRVLGREFGVWHTTIAAIVHRRTWTHLT